MLSISPTADRGRKAGESALLIDVRDVADMLHCSPRHVYRLSDRGGMPRPLKLGTLVRWERAAVERWIANGCPPVRTITSRRP